MKTLKDAALVGVIMGDVMLKELFDNTDMHGSDIYDEIASAATRYVKSEIFCEGEDVFEQAEMIARKRLAELLEKQKESDD